MMLPRRRLLTAATAAFGAALIAPAVQSETRPIANPKRKSTGRLGKASLPGPRLIVGFRGQDPIDDEVQSIARDIEAGRVAGVLLLKRNISSVDQLRGLCDFLTSAAPDLPPLICIDQEGGAVSRATPAGGFLGWSSAAALGAKFSNEVEAEVYYRPRAAQLTAAGVTLNFGPVVDLNINPANPIIGSLGRSYGADPDHVIAMARGFIAAHRGAGLRTCLKHFPGHGSANGDTHDGFVDIGASWREVELEPYRQLIAEGQAQAVMNAHLYHPAFSDAEGRPASLSRLCVQRLRGELGFGGVTFSDDMQMGAVTEHFDEGAAAVLATAAGNDLLIYSNFERRDPELAGRLTAVLTEALVDGKFDARALDASTARVDKLRRG